MSSRLYRCVSSPTEAQETLSPVTFQKPVGFCAQRDDEDIPTGPVGVPVMITQDCTVAEVYIVAEETGSITVDVWKAAFADSPATVDDSIIGEGTKPFLSSESKRHFSSVDWDTTILSAGDELRFNIDANSGIRNFTLTLVVEVRL